MDKVPGIAIIVCITIDVSSGVNPPHIGPGSDRDSIELSGNFSPVVVLPGIAIDVVVGVNSPYCAIGSCANIRQVTRDVNPRLAVISRVAVNIAGGVDAPDIGDRTSRDSFETA